MTVFTFMCHVDVVLCIGIFFTAAILGMSTHHEDNDVPAVDPTTETRGHGATEAEGAAGGAGASQDGLDVVGVAVWRLGVVVVRSPLRSSHTCLKT